MNCENMPNVHKDPSRTSRGSKPCKQGSKTGWNIAVVKLISFSLLAIFQLFISIFKTGSSVA